MGASRCSAGASPRPVGRSRRGGFTLLEMMMALALFAASIGVLLAAQAAAARHEAHAQRVFTVSTLARELLTETELLSYPDVGETSGDFGKEFPDYAWKKTVQDASLGADLLSSAAALGVDTAQLALAAPGLREIRLTITWTEREIPQSTEIVYYVVQP